MVIRFSVTQDMLDRFVELTGDRTSLHVSEEFARRSRYRRRVVHGMLPFSHLLLIQIERPDRRLELLRCVTRFHGPLFAGDTVTLEARLDAQEADGGELGYEAEWRDDKSGRLLISSSGAFLVLRPESNDHAASSRAASFLIEHVDEAAWTIDQLADRRDALHFRLDAWTTAGYWRDVLGNEPPPGCPGRNLLAALLLSTLVAMRLPGRYATFTGFELSFEQVLGARENHELVGTVTKVSIGSASAELSVSIVDDAGEVATGRATTLVNQPPVPTIGAGEIKARYLDLGLNDRVAIVTGGSRGIGAATAKVLAMHGAKVVVGYFRGKGDAEEVVEDIRAEGGTAISVACDVTDEAAARDIVARAVGEFNTVHVLVNNAVGDFEPRDVVELRWDDFLAELEVSLKGVHLCCREVIPVFRAEGGGKIVNLSTTAVDIPVRGQSKYIAAKSAVVGYTRSLARELANANVQVNAVAPTMTETDLLAAIPPTIVRRLGQARPIGRNLRPVEVAQSICFLASRWSDPITGQTLVLNLGEPPFH